MQLQMQKTVFFVIYNYILVGFLGIEGQLSFQELGSTGAPMLTLQAGIDDFSEGPISVATGIPYLGSEMATDVYITDNGLISFNNEFVDAPQSAGNDFSAADGMDVVVIAPYWSDNDIRLSGVVSYAVFETSHPDPAVSDRILGVSTFVSNNTMSVFNATWMLLVEWEDCQPFSADPTIDPDFSASTNTYQLVVITDLVSQSYVIFIYECDQIEWSGIDPIYARVGISNGPGASYIHPSSGNASVLDIDCANSPVSNFVNVLLDLNTFAPVEQPVSPSSTSTPGLTFSLISSSVTAITPSSTLPSPLATSAFTTQTGPVSSRLSIVSMASSTVTTPHTTSTVSFAPSPTNFQNNTGMILSTPPHVIVIPTLVAFFIIIGSVLVIILCLYVYHKKGTQSGKVVPKGDIEIVDLI